MDSVAVREGLRRLDSISQAEYGTTFAVSTNVSDEKLAIRRMARLTGIELKRPFSKPEPIQGWSETGARQQWLFREELRDYSPGSATALTSLKGDQSYELELRIFHELELQHFAGIQGYTFARFLENNHNESNWFLMLLRAAQPYLCENSTATPSAKPDSALRKTFWDLARDAAGQVLDAGMHKSLETAGATLVTLVPFLAGAPVAVTTGLTFFLVHFAKKGYCNATIETEIIQTLGYSGDYEKR
jgi:hypothetical protein